MQDLCYLLFGSIDFLFGLVLIMYQGIDLHSLEHSGGFLLLLEQVITND